MIKHICRRLSSCFTHTSESAADGRISTLDGHTFAVQNIHVRKGLRPYRARKHDNNPVILYAHHGWKCLTWRFIQTGENCYRLINFYTGKTLDVPHGPDEGVAVVQSIDQGGAEWEFHETASGAYTIRLVGTQLYITALSDKTNSPVTLSHFTDINGQKWRLIRQKPWF